MKKLLAIALITASFSAIAAADFDPDWTVVNKSGDKIYTILPKTATQAVAKDGKPYVTVVGEFRKGADDNPSRFRIGVTGCDNPEVGGLIVLANVTGSEVFLKEMWVTGGGRVYDSLALGACNAYGIQSGKYPPLDEQPSPAPKSKRSLGNTI